VDNKSRHMMSRELNAVYRLAYKLTRSVIKAEELVLETYRLAVKEERTGPPTGSSTRVWLFRILHCAYRNDLGNESHESLRLDFPDKLLAGVKPLADKIDWERKNLKLRAGLASLPAFHRSVMLMWAVEGLSFEEIAYVLDTPTGTVIGYLNWARQTLAICAD
jgi:RNA polymerase sigma-70 factor (ECF subfamily)